MSDGRLAGLVTLAALRSAHSAARLAPRQAEVDALRNQTTALSDAPEAEVADVIQAMIQDSHARWRLEELRRLTMRLALAEAAAQPLRETHARDRAREAVLDRLSQRHCR